MNARRKENTVVLTLCIIGMVIIVIIGLILALAGYRPVMAADLERFAPPSKGKRLDNEKINLRGAPCTIAGKMVRNEMGQFYNYLIAVSESGTLMVLPVNDATFNNAIVGCRAFTAKNAEGLHVLSGYLIE